ncbi:hypothetical protein D3C77_450950 [compost metagenome]
MRIGLVVLTIPRNIGQSHRIVTHKIIHRLIHRLQIIKILTKVIGVAKKYHFIGNNGVGAPIITFVSRQQHGIPFPVER